MDGEGVYVEIMVVGMGEGVKEAFQVMETIGVRELMGVTVTGDAC